MDMQYGLLALVAVRPPRIERKDPGAEDAYYAHFGEGQLARLARMLWLSPAAGEGRRPLCAKNRRDTRPFAVVTRAQR